MADIKKIDTPITIFLFSIALIFYIGYKRFTKCFIINGFYPFVLEVWQATLVIDTFEHLDVILVPGLLSFSSFHILLNKYDERHSSCPPRSYQIFGLNNW
jgi:hypothetical protein